MDKKRINPNQDSLLEDLIRTCNELHNTSRKAAQTSTAKGYCGPLRWQQSCDQMIAIPRQKLTFRLELKTTSSADFDDVFYVRLQRRLPPTLVFDRIVSVLVDGLPSRPTNHSLFRSLDLAFSRMAAGSTVVLSYQVRVPFNAEPCSVVLDDLNMRWSWISRSRKLIAHHQHLPIPAKHVDVSAVTSKSLQPV